MNKQSQESARETDLVALSKWQQGVGVTPVTTWRWRRRGWIETINISGRVYIAKSEIDKFTRRAASGEFSQVHRAPARSAS